MSRSVAKDAKTTDRRARLHRALDRVMDTKSDEELVKEFFPYAIPRGKKAWAKAAELLRTYSPAELQKLKESLRTNGKDWISKPAPAQRKVLSILKPEDLERMTGIKGAKLKDAAPSSGFYVEFAKRPGQFFKVANEDDKHVDAACKKAGLYKKGAEYPGFTIYKDGEEWGGGGGSNSGTMKDAASCPNCVAGKRPNGKVCGKCGGTGKANDTSPFDRDTDAGAAKIVKREAAAGLTARQIVAKYGFSLSFVQEEMGGGKAKDTALSLLPV